MEREKKKLDFLDVCVNYKDPFCLLTSVHRKKTFTGLFTNLFSFTSYSYQIGLIRTLVDRACEINDSLATFNDSVKDLYSLFKMNQYPERLMNKVVKSNLFKILIIPFYLLILLLIISSCHFLHLPILPSVRCVCLSRSIAKILKPN